MTNRTEVKGRAKDSTRSSYFSTCVGLQDPKAKQFFRRKLCFGTFFCKILKLAFWVKTFLTPGLRIKSSNRKGAVGSN